MSRRSRKSNSAAGRSRKYDPFKKGSAQALFYLNAILWYLYAFYIVIDMSAVNNSRYSVAAVGVFVAVNASAMLAAGVLITRSQKWIYYFALVITVLNFFLALTNITDYFYVIAFILDLFIFWMLFVLRKGYPSNS